MTEDRGEQKEIPTVLAPLEAGERLVVGEDPKNPLIEVSRCVHQPPPGKPIKLNSDQRTHFSALLSNAPALLTNAQTAASNMYVVTFAPDVAAKMSRLMPGPDGGVRFDAMNKSGQIIGKGVGHTPVAVKAAATVAAIWQCAAIATAQVHLAEINERLASIQRGVDHIIALLEAEQKGKLTANLKYLIEAGLMVQRDALNEETRTARIHQVERIWLENSQIAEAQAIMLGRAPLAFQNLNLNAWWDLDGSQRLADEEVARFEQSVQAQLLSTSARLAGIAIGVMLGEQASITEGRLKEIRASTATLRETVDSFFKVAEKRATSELKAYFAWKETNSDAQNKFLLNLKETRQRIGDALQQADVFRNKVQIQHEVLLKALQQPLHVVATLDANGQLEDVYQLV